MKIVFETDNKKIELPVNTNFLKEDRVDIGSSLGDLVEISLDTGIGYKAYKMYIPKREWVRMLADNKAYNEGKNDKLVNT